MSLVVHDEPRSGRWSKPPRFASGGGGLVSTAAAAILRSLRAEMNCSLRWPNEGKEFLGTSFYDCTKKEKKSVLDFSWDVDGLTFSKDGELLLAVVNEDGYSKPKLYDARTLQQIPDFNTKNESSTDKTSKSVAGQSWK